MANNMKDFVGTWTVRWVSGESPWLESGWTIEIGGTAFGSKPPFLNGECQVCTGFAVLSSLNPVTVVLSSAEQDEFHQPLALMLADGSLRWSGWYNGQPLRLYMSISAVETAGGTYRSLYGSTTWGDPDQVAVWGADGTGSGGAGG